MGKKRYLEENVKGLSGGESQKLALAYLLSDKTRIFIFWTNLQLRLI